MERHIEPSKIVLLFDKYTTESQYLHESVKQAGYECIAIVIDENNFLPKDVFSVYDLFIGNFMEERIGKPRFFNEIMVPDNWTISAGVNEAHGKITYQHEEKGRIYYAEIAEKYMVKEVEWYDRKGVTRFRDYYDRYGSICARTVCDAKGRQMSKTWFSSEEREIIVENLITGDIILNDGGFVKLFQKKTDMICYYLQRLGIKNNRIFYNSLANSFMISNKLEGAKKEDVLFWQEPIGEKIPGNMQMILRGNAGRTSKIMVQRRDAYDKLIDLGINQKLVHRLGFIYPFVKKNAHNSDVLICTRSDEIEHCQEFINALHQVHFHIAAPTVMSAKLMDLEDYENVSLYPAISKQELDGLLKKCDYYFDINHYSAVDMVMHQAFLHNLLIFAFQETVHDRGLVADSHVYLTAEFEKMVSDIKNIIGNEGVVRKHLNIQHEWALAEESEAYRKLLN